MLEFFLNNRKLYFNFLTTPKKKLKIRVKYKPDSTGEKVAISASAFTTVVFN